MNRRAGSRVYMTCACCGGKFWGVREDTLLVYCHVVTGMPVEKGSFGAQLRPVGPCCREDVLAALAADPADALGELRWSIA